MAELTTTRRLSRRSFLSQTAAISAAAFSANALLSACGESTPTSTSPVTLTIMNDSGALTPAYKTEFEKLNPTIKLNRIDFSTTRLSSMLAAGGPPDIVRTGGAPEIPNFAARGLALNLDPYFEKSSVLKAEDLQPVNDVYRWDGKQGTGPRYGMAQDWSQDLMMWYDKTLFDKHKIPYPNSEKPYTFEQLLEVGKQLTERQGSKIKVFGLDIGSAWVPYAALIQALSQQGGSLFNNDYTQANFKQDGVRGFFQWVVDWAQAHVGPSPLDASSEWAQTLMPAHREGMVLFGYWCGGLFDSKQIQDFGFAPAPQFGTTKRVSGCFSGTGAWIPKNAKNKDQAWKYFEYYMGQTPAKDRAKSGFGIPSLKSLFSQMPQDPSSRKQAFDTQQKELEHLDVLHFTPYVPLSSMVQVISDNLTKVMQKQTTLDAAIGQIQSTIDVLMTQGKSQIG